MKSQLTKLEWKETPEGDYRAGDFVIVKQDTRHATEPYVLFRPPLTAPQGYGTLEECKEWAENPTGD